MRWVFRSQEEGHFSEHWTLVNSAARESFDQVVNIDLFSEDRVESLTKLSQLLLLEKPDITHFEWFHDFEEIVESLADVFDSYQLKWISVAGVSSVLREGHQDEILRSKMLNLAKRKYLMGLMTWDYFLESRAHSKMPQIFGIPDFQDPEVASMHFPECKLFGDSQKIHIGVMGQLFNYRGSQELILAWCRNPVFRPFMIGQYQASSHPIGIRILIYILRKLRLLEFSGTWIKGSSALNHVLCHADAIFVDTTRYPFPSGIVIRSRQLGVPVIIKNADSFLRDLSQLDAGIVTIDLNRISKRELISLINKAKSQPKYKSASSFDLKAKIIDIWKTAEEIEN